MTAIFFWYEWKHYCNMYNYGLVVNSLPLKLMNLLIGIINEVRILHISVTNCGVYYIYAMFRNISKLSVVVLKHLYYYQVKQLPDNSVNSPPVCLCSVLMFTSDVFLFNSLYKTFTSVFWEAFIRFGGATPPRSSQTVYHAARTFWPNNSFFHPNSSVLQAKQITSSQSTFFTILLSKLLHLCLCLDFFTVLPFLICRVFALQCSPAVVIDI